MLMARKYIGNVPTTRVPIVYDGIYYYRECEAFFMFSTNDTIGLIQITIFFEWLICRGFFRLLFAAWNLIIYYSRVELIDS